MHLFGKSFTYKFYLLEDNQYIDISSSVLDSAYIFSSKPNRTDAKAGTGALKTISSWSDVDTNGKALAVPVLDDPNPNSSTSSETYYIVINFEIESGEQVQTVINSLSMCRPLSQVSQVGCTEADLEKIFPTIDSDISSASQASAITVAEESVKLDLQGNGFEWAKVNNPDRLKLAVAYKACSNLMISLSVENSDSWYERYLQYNNIYDKILTEIQFLYDADGDGEPESTENVDSFLRIIR